MAKKVKDIVIKTGEYADRNTGEIKARWQAVGALMKNDDGSIFILLEKWFNPAGVPSDRGTVLLNCFDAQSNGGGGDERKQSGRADDGGRKSKQQDIDDEIPF